jgi:hypothetical protein
MAAKRGEGAGLGGGGGGLQEHFGDGGNKVHWGLPVQDPCQGGSSGQSVASTRVPPSTLLCNHQPFRQPIQSVIQRKEIITKTLCFVIRLHCSLGERHP